MDKTGLKAVIIIRKGLRREILLFFSFFFPPILRKADPFTDKQVDRGW